MHITADQIAAIGRPHAASFEARAQAFLAAEYPRFANDPRLGRFVAHGRARAAAHGFLAEREIVLYLLAMVHLGARFDEDARHADLAPLLDAASGRGSEHRVHDLLARAALAPEAQALDGDDVPA